MTCCSRCRGWLARDTRSKSSSRCQAPITGREARTSSKAQLTSLHGDCTGTRQKESTMTASTTAVPYDTVIEEPLPKDTAKVSWGAIIAGLVVALGAWIILSVLGLAVGLSSVDPSQPA